MSEPTFYYTFDRETRELIGRGICRRLPNGDDVTYPSTHRSRTHVPPPEQVRPGYAPCFIEGKWDVVEDHRGSTVYATENGNPLVITALGPIPEGYTRTPPPDAFYVWDGNTWVNNVDMRVKALNNAIDVERDDKLLLLEFEGNIYRVDMASIAALGNAAVCAYAALSEGAGNGNLQWLEPGHDFAWIAENNRQIFMDARTLVRFHRAAVAWRSKHALVARSRKDGVFTPWPGE